MSKTLPIGYYPSLSDESLDAILLDQRPTTIEWMITPAEHAQHLDVESLIGTVARVSYSCYQYLTTEAG